WADGGGIDLDFCIADSTFFLANGLVLDEREEQGFDGTARGAPRGGPEGYERGAVGGGEE
ncbi:MAG: hypothetical protein LQ352_006236, partial [Teloschistes flavicans]